MPRCGAPHPPPRLSPHRLRLVGPGTKSLLMEPSDQGPRRFRGLSRDPRHLLDVRTLTGFERCPDLSVLPDGSQRPRRCMPTRSPIMGSVMFGSMAEQLTQQPRDPEGERVRRLRLRADGQRPLVVNLRETISLTHKLFELRDSARRAR